MRKSIWQALVVLNSFLVIVVIGLAYLFYQRRQDLRDKQAQQARLERLINQQEIERSTKGPVEVQAGMIEGTYLSVAYPLSDQGQPIVYIKEELEKFVKERYGDSHHVDTMKQAVFIDSTLSDTAFEGVRDYEVMLKTFRDGQAGLEQVETEVLEHVKISSDGQVFTLADFIVHPEQFKQLVTAHLSEVLVTKGLTEAQVSAQLLGFEREELADLDYVYGDGLLSLKLPGLTGVIEQVDLPLSALYAVINPVFLKGEEAVAYQIYQQ